MSWVKTIGSVINRIRSVLVVLGWAVSLASLALTSIFYGIVIPRAAVKPNMPVQGVVLYYAGIFAVSLLAGMVLASIALTLIGSFVASGIAASLTYFALIIPGLTGVIDQAIAENLALGFVFGAFFPFGLFIGLLGGMLGAVSTEI